MMLNLTARELAVVRLVAQGRSNKEVGRALGIAEGTVKCHLHAIYDKSGLRSRFELLRVTMMGEPL